MQGGRGRGRRRRGRVGGEEGGGEGEEEREGEENKFRWDGLARQTTQVARSINLSAITFTDCMPDEGLMGKTLH